MNFAWMQSVWEDKKTKKRNDLQPHADIFGDGMRSHRLIRYW